MPLNADGSFTLQDTENYFSEMGYTEKFNVASGKFELIKEGGPGSGRYPAGSGASPRSSRARTSELGFKQPGVPKGCPGYQGKATFSKQAWMTSSAELHAKVDADGNAMYVKAAGDERADAEGNKLDSAGQRTAIVTDERQQYYRELAAFQLSNSGATVQENPVNVIMGGSSGAGKTEFLASPDGSKLVPKDCVTVDCDKIKSQLGEYREVQLNDAAWTGAAAFAHEESSVISEMALKMSLDGKYNTVLDSTGDGEELKYLAKLEAMAVNGPTSLVYVAIPLKDSLASVASRAERTRRDIPVHVVTELHAGVTDRFLTAMRVRDDSKYRVSKITLVERRDKTSPDRGFNSILTADKGKEVVFHSVDAQRKYADFRGYGKKT